MHIFIDIWSVWVFCLFFIFKEWHPLSFAVTSLVFMAMFLVSSRRPDSWAQEASDANRDAGEKEDEEGRLGASQREDRARLLRWTEGERPKEAFYLCMQMVASCQTKAVRTRVAGEAPLRFFCEWTDICDRFSRYDTGMFQVILWYEYQFGFCKTKQNAWGLQFYWIYD